ncbi:MAG: T9SS type A sorting domain-containing protein [Bacteroidetes bacterium]|nr:T9SS type A sorting domain-containing protein [Bacteroidota bacterium]
MKKLLFITFAILFAKNFSNAQVNMVLEAPPNNNSTTTGRAPNGTSAHAYMRGAELVLASELTNIPINTAITAFGFTLSAPANANCVGNFTVYLQNTNDVTYNKGVAWGGIITGMTTAYTGIMTVPNAGNSIMLTLTTPFVYTGGGLYVAWDWESAGPYASTLATYWCESAALNPGCVSANSASSPAPVTLATTAFRPSLLFQWINPYSNDMEVIGINSPGYINAVFNTPHNIVAIIKNSSNATLPSSTASLSVTGANPFTDVQNVPTLAAGATATVTFAAFNPTVLGANTVSVYVGSDQNNANNSAIYSQSVTCGMVSNNPAVSSYTSGGGVGYGTGSGLIVTPLVPPVNAVLTGIRGSGSPDLPSVGKTVYGVLLNAVGNIIAVTNQIVIPAVSTTFNFVFNTPQNLTANTVYHIGFAQTANPTAYYPAGYISPSYVTPNLYYSAVLAGGALSAVNLSLYMDIEGVFANNFLTASASPLAFCAGGEVSLTSVGTAVSYTWSTGANTFSTTDIPSASTTYSIVGEDLYGCTNTRTIPVTVNPLPVVNATSNHSEVCLGSPVTLFASGAQTYTWTSPTVTNNASGFNNTPTVTTTYTVIGRNVFGCTDTNYVSVTVHSVDLSISPSTVICRGDAVTLSASGANTYTWSNGDNFSDITVSPTVSTNYIVNARGAGDCPASASVDVTVNPRPTLIAFSTKSLVCTNNTVTLMSSGAISYTWNTGATTSSIIVSSLSQATIIYTVSGSNAFDCVGTTTVAQTMTLCTGVEELNSENLELKVYPNPNNGVFTIEFVNSMDNGKIEIRNTLGQVVKQELISSSASVEIDMSNEANGMYFIYITSDNRTVKSGKIMKQ